MAVPLMAPLAFFFEFKQASQSPALSDPSFW